MPDIDHPADGDELVDINKLDHGEHNPRKVPPSEELRRDIKKNGIREPLVVRPKEGTNRYYVTDGWQRYQAASELGFEELPVDIYYETEEALSVAESKSLGKEWGTYEWAKHCESVAETINVYDESEVVSEVTDRVNKTRVTVQKYLRAMRLPEEVINTVVDKSGRGRESDWNALANHNDKVKQYDGISWEVAEELGKYSHRLTEEEAIKFAAHAVSYDAETGKEFVEIAVRNKEKPISEIHKMVAYEGDADKYLTFSGTMSIGEDKKQSLHQYCSRRRQQVSEVAEELLEAFIETVHEEDEPPSVREFLE